MANETFNLIVEEPEHWKKVMEWKTDRAYGSATTYAECLLDLRSRLEALEGKGK